MYIRRTAFLNTQHMTQTLLQKPITLGLCSILAITLAIVSQNVFFAPSNAHAITPPDSCFSVTNGVLDFYFQNQQGAPDGDFIPCPKDVIIPSTINSMAITVINSRAFYNSGVTSVVIPNGVTSIGEHAFASNQLTSADIPNSVTEIGEHAFEMNLLTSITIPTGLSTIGANVFAGNKLTSLTLPSSIESIENNAFSNNQLTTLTVPIGVTYISDFAFAYNKLTSVTFPNTLTYLAAYAFYNNKLESLTIPSNVNRIGNSAFSNNEIVSLTIENGVETIGQYAFSNNQISSLNLPASVTHINYGTFSGNKIASLTLAEGLEIIGNGAFSSNLLTEITIPASVTAIETGAFMDNRLTSLTIPNSVTSLGQYVFEANQLTSLTLGCGVPSLTKELFAINKLENVTVPDCITSINPSAFFGQNPWGGVVDWGYDEEHDWYSSDPAVLKNIFDNIWYVRLHTANSENPNHLFDGILVEDWYTGDINNDGDSDDSLGGHIVNAASLTARYTKNTGEQLAADFTSSGQLDDGTNLSNYLIKNFPTPVPNNPYAPTNEEQAAVGAALSGFNRIGAIVTLAALDIPNYTIDHPASPHNATLNNKNTIVNFVYKANTAAGVPTVPTPVTPQPTPPITLPVQTNTSVATVNPPISFENTAIDATPTTPTSKRTTVDFTTHKGTNAVPSGLPASLANSRLTTDTSKSCHQISTASLLPRTSFTTPDSTYETLGGLAFALDCDTIGGEASITLTLGEVVSDLSKIKVYKKDTQGQIKNVTSLIALSNTSPIGYTTISYNLTDGAVFDDDGSANKSISDPIYFAVARDGQLPQATMGPQISQREYDNTTFSVLAIAGLIIVTVITSVIIIRKKRHA